MKKIVKDDIVRYPLGLHELIVRKVYEDEKGDVYVRERINTPNEYKRYIYRSMDGYKWNTSLNNELGFRLAKESELIYLQD